MSEQVSGISGISLNATDFREGVTICCTGLPVRILANKVLSGSVVTILANNVLSGSVVRIKTDVKHD